MVSLAKVLINFPKSLIVLASFSQRSSTPVLGFLGGFECLCAWRSLFLFAAKCGAVIASRSNSANIQSSIPPLRSSSLSAAVRFMFVEFESSLLCVGLFLSSEFVSSGSLLFDVCVVIVWGDNCALGGAKCSTGNVAPSCVDDANFASCKFSHRPHVPG